MHCHLRTHGLPLYRATLLIALIFCAGLRGEVLALEPTKTFWLVSNGFHTSLAFRVRDLPEGRAIAGDPQADAVLVGWGARDFYQGKVNPWTFGHALCGSPSILHVVPVRGRVERRFAHSDIIEFRLPSTELRRLAARIDQAFARDEKGGLLIVGRGYFADSRFFAGREHFCFVKMCNFWVAQKLRTVGLAICLPNAISATELTRQVERFGDRRQQRRRPLDAF